MRLEGISEYILKHRHDAGARFVGDAEGVK